MYSRLWLYCWVSLLVAVPVLGETATIYSDRDAFYGQLSIVVIDDYESNQYSLSKMIDTEMSGVLEETTYISTGNTAGVHFVNSSNFNAASDAWCNGCNLRTRLDFTTTSVGTVSGVINAGFDIVAMRNVLPALVTFGDDSVQSYTLPSVTDFSTGSPYGFWGINSSLRIKSIEFNTQGSFSAGVGLDNLVIGGSGDGMGPSELQYHGVPAIVPIPAALPLFGSALGLMGFLGWNRKKAA